MTATKCDSAMIQCFMEGPLFLPFGKSVPCFMAIKLQPLAVVRMEWLPTLSGSAQLYYVGIPFARHPSTSGAKFDP